MKEGLPQHCGRELLFSGGSSLDWLYSDFMGEYLTNAWALVPETDSLDQDGLNGYIL